MEKESEGAAVTDHDGLYHPLFSHPHMMTDLLRQFVAEPLVRDLDLARMEPVKTKFHIPGLPKRESDVVWRIPLRSGSDIYLLVLVEFQSEVDRWMILRVIVYQCMLWLQLLHEKAIPASGPLPPLFPLVLHNGDQPWRTPVRLRDLIGLPEGSPLWRFQPGGQFFLIDETRFTPKDLEERDSLSALVFRIERCSSPEELPALAEEIITWFKGHPEYGELRMVVAAMLMNAMTILGGDPPSLTDRPIDLLEVPTMLQTRMEAWKEAWINEKQQQWHLEGHQKGRHEEATHVLRRLLQKKYRARELPLWVEEKLAGATLEKIESWTDRILDARTLEDVFKN